MQQGTKRNREEAPELVNMRTGAEEELVFATPPLRGDSQMQQEAKLAEVNTKRGRAKEVVSSKKRTKKQKVDATTLSEDQTKRGRDKKELPSSNKRPKTDSEQETARSQRAVGTTGAHNPLPSSLLDAVDDWFPTCQELWALYRDFRYRRLTIAATRQSMGPGEFLRLIPCTGFGLFFPSDNADPFLACCHLNARNALQKGCEVYVNNQFPHIINSIPVDNTLDAFQADVNFNEKDVPQLFDDARSWYPHPRNLSVLHRLLTFAQYQERKREHIKAEHFLLLLPACEVGLGLVFAGKTSYVCFCRTLKTRKRLTEGCECAVFGRFITDFL